MATIDRRSTREGQPRWRARVRRRGFHETASFDSRSEAEKWAREVEQAIERGIWTGGRSDGALTFGWTLDRYIAARRPNRDTRRQLQWWRHHLGSKTAASISRRTLLDLRGRLARETATTRGRPRSPATVNRYVAALSGLFSWAVEKGWIAVHPVKGLEPLIENPARIRCLSREERQALIPACRRRGGVRLQTLVVLALSTGARRGELMSLQWSDLDLLERSVTFRGVSGGKRRILPLPVPSIRLLRQLSKVRRIDGNEVFAEPGGSLAFPRSAWKSALEAAEIEDFRFHDLRHSTASYLAMSGASLPEIAEVLGHKTLQGVRRYSHLAANYHPTAISRMHQRLFDD